MSNSSHTHVNMDEELPLKSVSGGVQNNGTCSGKDHVISSRDKHYRRLAIFSIICGISCIGIKSLINSVKAEHTTEPLAAATFSQKAKKYGIISIVTGVAILVSIPILMALVSYLFTLID